MIEAEASRIAMLNAALPRAGIPIPEAKGLFKPETANLNAFLLDGHTARRRHCPPHLCGISPLEFEQFHNCLFMFPHLRFHRPFVQMVVAQKVKHRVRHQVRQLAAVGVAVFLRLRGDVLE